MEAPEQIDGENAEAGDDPVISPRPREIDTCDDRAHDAAETAFAAGYRGPAERDREQHRGERKRQQREIDAATAQDQEAREPREDRDGEDREQQRNDDVAWKPVALRQCCRIARKAEERPVAERHEAGVADQDVQAHAGDGEYHDIGRGRQRQSDRQQDERKRDHRYGSNEQRQIFFLHRAHSNFWMRSPNRPRGRNSSTSTISRYIEASLAGGRK